MACTLKHYRFTVNGLRNKLVCFSKPVKVTTITNTLIYYIIWEISVNYESIGRHDTQHNNIQHNDT
jgi:hypothetical protein